MHATVIDNHHSRQCARTCRQPLERPASAPRVPLPRTGCSAETCAEAPTHAHRSSGTPKARNAPTTLLAAQSAMNPLRKKSAAGGVPFHPHPEELHLVVKPRDEPCSAPLHPPPAEEAHRDHSLRTSPSVTCS